LCEYVFSLCKSILDFFFSYKYNDTQFSCVFEKKKKINVDFNELKADHSKLPRLKRCNKLEKVCDCPWIRSVNSKKSQVFEESLRS